MSSDDPILAALARLEAHLAAVRGEVSTLRIDIMARMDRVENETTSTLLTLRVQTPLVDAMADAASTQGTTQKIIITHGRSPQPDSTCRRSTWKTARHAVADEKEAR